MTAGKLLAYMLAHGVHELDKHLAPGAGGRNRILDMASAWLWSVLNNIQYAGPLKGDEECDGIVKGTFALFGVDKVDDGKNLLALIAGSAEAHAALVRLVRNHFNSTSWNFNL